MDPKKLAAAAEEFCNAWGAGAAGEARLRACLAQGVVFRPDGVVFHHELHGGTSAAHTEWHSALRLVRVTPGRAPCRALHCAG